MVQLNVTFLNSNDDSELDAELLDLMTVREVLQELINVNFLPALRTGTFYGLSVVPFGPMLPEDQSFADANIRNGDTLRVSVSQRGGGGISIRSFREIQLVEAILNHSDVVQRMNRSHILFAVFLYTEQDLELASYIRDNVQELHYMAGHRCMFFTIEKPAPEWDWAIRQTLGELAGEYFDVLWERLGTNSFRPFDYNQAYTIGRHFGILPEQFPCVVFFSELKSRDVLIIEIKKYITESGSDPAQDYTQFFRVLFSSVEEAQTKPSDQWLLELSKVLARKWHKTMKRSSKPVESMQLAKAIIEVIGSVVKGFM